MTPHESAASWVNPLVVEAERAHQERELLLSTLRWVSGRIDGFLGYAGEARRPLEPSTYAEVLNEIADEVNRALRAAQEEA